MTAKIDVPNAAWQCECGKWNAAGRDICWKCHKPKVVTREVRRSEVVPTTAKEETLEPTAKRKAARPRKVGGKAADSKSEGVRRRNVERHARKEVVLPGDTADKPKQVRRSASKGNSKVLVPRVSRKPRKTTKAKD